MKRRIFMLAAVVLLLGASRAWAHHSFNAEYDGTQKIQVEGSVTEFAWRNPHSFMKIDVMGKDGTTESWTLEWGSATQLSNSQITRTTLKPGDKVVVNGRASRDPSAHRMLLTDVKRASDGWEWHGQAR